MSGTRLIERWLPIADIGIESTHERTPMTPFPPPEPVARVVGAPAIGGLTGGDPCIAVARGR